MDLRQLRYFVAVAERGGFGTAASALNVAQSALSRHVSVLEEELGGALLDRGARGVSVTESGKVLLARGRWLLGASTTSRPRCSTENRDPSGTVRLGAPSSLARHPLCAARPPYSPNRFPRVQLELSEGLNEDMTDRLLRGELDLAVVTAPPPNDHLEYETLVVEQVFLIGPPARSPASTRQAYAQGVRCAAHRCGTAQPQPFPANVPSSFRVESMHAAQADGGRGPRLRPAALLRHP